MKKAEDNDIPPITIKSDRNSQTIVIKFFPTFFKFFYLMLNNIVVQLRYFTIENLYSESYILIRGYN